MARTDETAVSAVIDTSLETSQIEAFIDDASLWVDKHLVGEGLTADELTAIEKYLACHFITLRDPRLKSAQLDDVAEVYQRDLYVTEYLKSAAALDSTGRVREHFMAPKNTRRLVFQAGTGYDE